MPYSGPGDDNLPESVKKLGDKDKRQWVAVFNSAYEKCTSEGGGDCEASAFAQANGVVKGRMNPIQELYEKIKRLFEPHLPERTEYLPTDVRAFTVTRTADGVPRWLLIAASAVVNRVNAIDSTTLFDNFIKHALEAREFPILDFLHQENMLRFGQADWLARDGALYLASGTFDDTELARAAIAGLESDPAYWGASISYNVTSQPLLLVGEGQIPVYEDGFNNYISIVPKRMAANLFTAATVAEEVRRMDKKTFEELVRLVGPAAAQQFADQVDDANRTITETGMVTRAADETNTPPEAVAVVETTATAPVENRDVVVEAALPVAPAEPMPPIITIEVLADKVAALEEALKSVIGLGAQVEEMARTATEQKRAAETTLGDLTTRLAGVESSKQRWDDWLNDAPEHIKQAAELVRARNQPAALMTAAQIAEQTVSKMSKEPLRRRMPQ